MGLIPESRIFSKAQQEQFLNPESGVIPDHRPQTRKNIPGQWDITVGRMVLGDHLCCQGRNGASSQSDKSLHPHPGLQISFMQQLYIILYSILNLNHTQQRLEIPPGSQLRTCSWQISGDLMRSKALKWVSHMQGNWPPHYILTLAQCSNFTGLSLLLQLVIQCTPDSLMHNLSYLKWKA